MKLKISTCLKLAFPLVILGMSALVYTHNYGQYSKKTFPYSKCRADLHISNNINMTDKEYVKLKLFFLFSDNHTGNIEFSGELVKSNQRSLFKGRYDFDYSYDESILQLKNVQKKINSRYERNVTNVILPEFLEINGVDISFLTRKLSSNEVLLTRYDEPAFVIQCPDYLSINDGR